MFEQDIMSLNADSTLPGWCQMFVCSRYPGPQLFKFEGSQVRICNRSPAITTQWKQRLQRQSQDITYQTLGKLEWFVHDA
jgi:hypothetical protein